MINHFKITAVVFHNLEEEKDNRNGKLLLCLLLAEVIKEISLK
jgi:hypothetical protein